MLYTFHPEHPKSPSLAGARDDCSYLFFKARLDCVWVLCCFFLYFPLKGLASKSKDVGEFLGGYYLFSVTWLALFVKIVSESTWLSWLRAIWFFSVFLLLQAPGSFAEVNSRECWLLILCLFVYCSAFKQLFL